MNLFPKVLPPIGRGGAGWAADQWQTLRVVMELVSFTRD